MAKPIKICGILGGMGPEATVDLMGRIVRYTNAANDSEHVHCIVDQNPSVPSRVCAVLEGGPTPGPVLAEMARKLEAAGADFLCMPCNTAHNWLEEAKSGISIPFLDMPELAVADVAQKTRGHKCGILGTTATAKRGIYEPHCAKYGMEAIYPESADQQELLAIINEVKAGDHSGSGRFAAIAVRMTERGAESLIIACTELSALGLPANINAVVVDAADSLAYAIIQYAGADLKRA